MRPPAANRRPRIVTCAAFVVSMLVLAASGGASARPVEGPESLTLAVADLSVVKTGSPSAVAVGDEITYTLTVTNGGPDAAEEVMLRDFLPGGTVFVSASSGCTHSEGLVECPLGPMASGATVTKTITVTAQTVPISGVVWFNNAEVTAATDDPDADNNLAEAATTVKWQLTVSKEGSGTGTVTSAPAGIDCGADCAETYEHGTVVTLTANASGGSRFAGWSGACSGADTTCTVTMSAARAVTARFNAAHTLTVTKEGSGSGTVTSAPGGIDCGTDCAESFDAGTLVTLTANASVGSTFAGWGGACAGTSTTCAVTMDAAKSVTATFTGPVTPPNSPPNCSGVKATPKRLWPPDHKMRLVTLSGATDPDGDPVTLTITGVTQDEPIRRQGRGDRAPDAKRVAGHPNQVKLRAERKGTGNGRVYRIAFTVSDGRGGTCTGVARVQVRLSRHRPAVDSGRSFNSFGS